MSEQFKSGDGGENYKVERPVDITDALLAMGRQAILLAMMSQDPSNTDTTMWMYEHTTDRDQVDAEREALEKDRIGEPGTPSGQLATLYFKLDRSDPSET